ILLGRKHEFKKRYIRTFYAAFVVFIRSYCILLQPVIFLYKGEKKVGIGVYHQRYLSISSSVSFFIFSIVMPLGSFLPSIASAFRGSLGRALSKIPLSVSMATNFWPYFSTACLGSIILLLSSVVSIGIISPHYNQ